MPSYPLPGQSSAGGTRGQRRQGGYSLPSTPPPGRVRGRTASSHHHGFFGSIIHNPVTDVISRGAQDIYHTGVSSPAGFYDIGKAVFQDVRAHPYLALTPYLGEAVLGAQGRSHLVTDVGKPLVSQTIRSFEHPGEHPGVTLLNAIAALSLGVGGAARVGAVGGALRAGEGLGGAADALRAVSRPEPLVLRGAQGFTAKLPAARPILSRLVQAKINDLRNRFPDTHLGVRTQTYRVGIILKHQRGIDYAIQTADARGLLWRGRKIKRFSPSGVAIRLRAEGTPPDIQLAMLRKDLAGAKKRWIRSNIEKQIRITEKARKLVTVAADGVVSIRDTELSALADHIEQIALEHDQRLAVQGMADPAMLEAAIQKPGRIARGATMQETPLSTLYTGNSDQWVGRSVTTSAGHTGSIVKIVGEAARPTARPVRIPLTPERIAELEAIVKTSPASYGDVAVIDAAKHDLGLGYEIAPTPGNIYSGAAQARADAYSSSIPSAATTEPAVATVRFHAKSGGVYTKDVPIHDLTVANTAHLVGAEDFTGGRFHIGQQIRRKPGSLHRAPAAGTSGVLNTGRLLPSRLRSPLTGQAAHTGQVTHDVARQVAENLLEAEKHAAAVRAAQFFYDHGQDTPAGLHNPVAVKAEELYGKGLPAPVRQIQDAYRAGETLTQAQTSLLGMTYETLRERLFPNLSQEEWQGLVDQGNVDAVKGIRWVERDLLGGLNEPPMLATFEANKAGRMAVAFVDAVNNATKFAILYLKPAYITPNVLGNTFLVLTQQGLLAPIEIGKAVRLHKLIGADNTVLVDTVMGEGISTSLGADRGLGQHVVQIAARGFGKIVDVPFRRASFLYEARRAGYKTRERLNALLNDPAERESLNMVVERANRAVIKYSDLTPFEQAVTRRILFFYPWLKGSTRYAGEYLTEHPLQSALLGNLGEYGQAQIDAQLGAIPSWAQGYFKVGGTLDRPLVSNPTAAGILGQPAQLAAIGASLFGGNVKSGYALRSLYSPFWDAGVTASSGRDSFGRPHPQTLGTFFGELYGGVPALTLGQRLTQDQSQRTFPLSHRDALLQFLVGGIVPKPANLPLLHKSAGLENKPRR